MLPTRAADLETGNPDHELAAIVALIRAGVVRAERLGTLVDSYGSAVRPARLSENDELFAEGDQTVIGAITPEGIGQALQDVQGWRQRHYDVRTVLDPDYPADLHAIFNRPPLLFFQGQWDPSRDRRSIAVVGARKATNGEIKWPTTTYQKASGRGIQPLGPGPSTIPPKSSSP